MVRVLRKFFSDIAASPSVLKQRFAHGHHPVALHPGGPEAEDVPPRVRYPEHGDRGEHVNARLDRGQRVVHAARDGQDAGANDGAVNGADQALRALIGGEALVR